MPSAYTAFIHPARLRPWLLVAGLSFLCFAFNLSPALRYDRALIAKGEVYRLVTGHLVHASAEHMLLNLAGLLLTAMLFHQQTRPLRFTLELLVICLLLSSFIWFAEPGVQRYLGLSGVLHGLYLIGAARLWQGESRFGLVLVGLLVLKLTLEQMTGGSLFYESRNVLNSAHTFGVLSGTLVLVGSELVARYGEQRRNK